MKIIRLSTFLDFGGIESKMVNISSCQDDENEWIFVAIGKGGDAEKKIKTKGKKVIILNLPYKIPSLKTIWKLYQFLKKENPDVLHTSGAEANFFGFFAGKLAGVPKTIVEEIGIPNHSSKAKIIFQFIFRNADFVVGESRIVVNHIRSAFGLKEDKSKVVHNFGIFNYDFSGLENQKSKYEFRMIMISRLEPVKNIEGVLNVFSRIKNDIEMNVKLIIAGSGQSETLLNQKVKDLGLENEVEFLGFINDPYPYLANADLYILNSHSEGFSNSLVEAMYSGTPSLSTNVGAAPEIIQDGVNGFIVPVNDEEALYEKLNEIIRLSESERNEMGKKGKETIVQNFSIEKHVYELMKIYKK